MNPLSNPILSVQAEGRDPKLSHCAIALVNSRLRLALHECVAVHDGENECDVVEGSMKDVHLEYQRLRKGTPKCQNFG